MGFSRREFPAEENRMQTHKVFVEKMQNRMQGDENEMFFLVLVLAEDAKCK